MRAAAILAALIVAGGLSWGGFEEHRTCGTLDAGRSVCRSALLHGAGRAEAWRRGLVVDIRAAGFPLN